MENTRKEFESLRTQYARKLPYECVNCGDNDNLQIHHIVPLAVGGTNKITNMAVLCEYCHEKVHGFEKGLFAMKQAGLKQFYKKGKRQQAPMGYDLVDNQLVPNKDAEFVRTIFRLRFVHKYSLGTVSKALNELEIESPKGSKWTHSIFTSRWFTNKAYFGVIEHEGEVVATFEDYIMKNEQYTWEDVDTHNKLDKGRKRVNYGNNDIEFVKEMLKPFVIYK